MRRYRLGRAVVTVLVSLTTFGLAAPAGAVAYPRPLDNQWWFTAWDIPNKVWPISQGDGVTVAVIDTGIQADIPDLSGVVLPGTDATGGGGDGRTDTDTAAVPGHGTGMASVIAAQGKGTGFLGVSPKVKILPIVADSMNSENAGIHYAVDHGAKVINISQGGPSRECPPSQQEAVSYAIQHDVVVVAAAGDYGTSTNAPLAPANCAGVLAVGAVDSNLKAWNGTERQPYVTVAAPGVGVGGVLKDGRFHTADGGTSPAAALTSAVVALVRSKFPDMSAREVVQRIIASCRDAGPPGKDEQTGYGAVRPWHALVDKVPKSAPNPVFDAYDKWAKANGQAASQNNGSQGDQKKKRDSFYLSPSLLIYLVPMVIAALVVGIALLSRRRSGKSPAYTGQAPPYGPTPGAYGPPQGPPPGRQEGPPPSFGPPQHHAPQGGGPRPSFEPPPNREAPPEHRS